MYIHTFIVVLVVVVVFSFRFFYVITIYGNSFVHSFLSYKLLIHRDITIYGKKSSFERKERERAKKNYIYKRKKDDDGETKKTH